jgi:asparagine synthase (glutamine-hydrolysing)
MSESLAHRGPDDHGLWQGDGVSLVHRRLSILDIDGGHQPMSSADGNLVVVFNGEIYNYPELREGLECGGRQFRTRCDTEVLLHMYAEDGPEFVGKLRGMFAFALWDSRRRQMMLARDHLGQKPLFFWQSGSTFGFASEMKALFASGLVRPEVDVDGLWDHTGLRFSPGDTTLFRGVKKLRPAQSLLLRPETGALEVKRYWKLDYSQKSSLSYADVADELESALQKSVKLHLLSDVPVGSYLSGGVDSSLVSAMAMPHSPELATFSVGPKDSEFSELGYSRWASETIGSVHRDHEFDVETDLLLLLPDIIWHMEEPSDTHAVGLYLLSRLARDHVKVVIGGDGGDEAFGGYVRFTESRVMSAYGRIPDAVRRRIIEPLLHRVPDSYGYYSVAAKVRWVHAMSLLEGAEKQYCAMTYFGFPDKLRDRLFSAQARRQLTHADTARWIAEHYNDPSCGDEVDRRLCTEMMTRMPEHFLQIADRMSMAHSLEARAPIVDREIAELSAQIPSRFKIRPGELKIILREVARRHYPAKLIDREKMGFKFPLAHWFKGPLATFITQSLGDACLFQAGLFEKSYVDELLDEHKSGRVDHNLKLWNLLNLEVWYRLFINGDSREEVRAWLAGLLGERTQASVRKSAAPGFL